MGIESRKILDGWDDKAMLTLVLGYFGFHLSERHRVFPFATVLYKQTREKNEDLEAAAADLAKSSGGK